MSDEFRVRLKAELDQGSLDKAVSKAKPNTALTIKNFSINSTDLVKQLQSALNKEKVKVKVEGNFDAIKNGQKEINKINSLYHEMLNLTKKIGSTDAKIKGLDVDKDAKQIEELTRQLEKLKSKLDDLKKNNSDKIANFSASQTSNLLKAQEEAQNKIAAAAAKAADKQVQAAERASKAQQKAADQAQKAADRAAKQAQTAQERAARQTEKEWNKAAAGMKKDFDKVRQETLTLTKSGTLSNNIQAWMAKNTQAANVFDAELQVILERLNGNTDPKVLSQMNAEFAKIQSQAKAAGLVTNDLAKSIKNVGLQVLGLGSAYQVIMKIINTVKTGVNTIIDLDTALVDLRKTTSMSDNELSRFYRDANDEAKKLGVTTQEIIEQAAAWSRLGYGSYHDATTMARLSSQFAAISPGMSVGEAQESLVSTMKAFGVETDEVLDGIMSKINILGNSFALSNKDLAEALKVSSASMKSANNTFEQTLALITAGTEITQDASRVGNGLRTISMRIRALNEETGEFDETLGNIKNDISNLTHGKVSIMEDENTYKSTYEILKRISEIWDELTDKEQAGLLEKLFGKNRAQIGAAILSNFEAAERAMEKMQNSAGNADAEMSIIMDSLEYKLNALKQTGVGIWQNLFPREDIGNAIEAITSLLEIIEKITDALGPAGTFSALLGIGAFAKNFA